MYDYCIQHGGKQRMIVNIFISDIWKTTKNRSLQTLNEISKDENLPLDFLMRITEDYNFISVDVLCSSIRRNIQRQNIRRIGYCRMC